MGAEWLQSVHTGEEQPKQEPAQKWCRQRCPQGPPKVLFSSMFYDLSVMYPCSGISPHSPHFRML